jgi:hypothetical protein
LLKKNQPRLIDLALSKTPPENLQHPPFFTGQHLESLFATREQQKTEKRKKEKTHNLHRYKHREEQKLLQPKG